MRTTISWRADCGHCMLFENLIYSLLFTLATLYRRDTSYRNYRVNFYMQTMSTSTRLNLVTVARANPSQNECMYILKIELFMLIWIIYCCFQSFCINANTNTTARSDCIDYFYQHFYLIKAVSERERIWKKTQIKIDFLFDWNRLRSIFSCDSIFTWYCCVCAPIHNSKGRTNKKNLTQLNLIGKLVFCYRKNSFQWKHLANEQILTPFDFCFFSILLFS